MSSWPYLNTMFSNVEVLWRVYSRILISSIKRQRCKAGAAIWQFLSFSIIALLQRYARGFAFVQVPVFPITSSHCSPQTIVLYWERLLLLLSSAQWLSKLLYQTDVFMFVTNILNVENSKLNIQRLSSNWMLCIDNASF